MSEWMAERAAQGVSRRELARRTGMDWRRISEWERGRGAPNGQQRLLLDSALGVSSMDVDLEAGVFLDERSYRRLRGWQADQVQVDEGHSWASLESRCADVVARLGPLPAVPVWLKKRMRAETGTEAVFLTGCWKLGFRGCVANPASCGFDLHAVVTAALSGLGARGEGVPSHRPGRPGGSDLVPGGAAVRGVGAARGLSAGRVLERTTALVRGGGGWLQPRGARAPRCCAGQSLANAGASVEHG